MSYHKGKILLGILAVLFVHILVGGFAYYRVIRLEKTKQVLGDENETLKIYNAKIEMIAKEHLATKQIIDKIYKAFGTQLGVSRQDFDALSTLELAANSGTTTIPAPKEALTRLDVQYQDRLPYLIEDKSDYFTPENMPTHLPVDGFMTTRFQKGSWYLGRNHVGIDIAAERGTSIRAAGKGVVLFADWTPDLGNLVVISHGSGYFTFYGHANHIIAHQGGLVNKGDVIALLGSSGISSAPHLHFEIWKDGQPLNPETFLYVIAQQSQDGQL